MGTTDASAGALVLVVEDEDAARRMMRRALERRGYEVAEAVNGEQGIAVAMEQLPAIILLDLRMPGELSGLDVAKKLREAVQTDRIPIVVVSASVHTDARAMIRDFGCDEFIEKPVDFALLYETIERLIGPG